jgi:hypothetical protein
MRERQLPGPAVLAHFASTPQVPGNPAQAWHASHVQYAGEANDGLATSALSFREGGDA